MRRSFAVLAVVGVILLLATTIAVTATENRRGTVADVWRLYQGKQVQIRWVDRGYVVTLAERSTPDAHVISEVGSDYVTLTPPDAAPQSQTKIVPLSMCELHVDVRLPRR